MLDIPDTHPALLFSATTKDIDSTVKVAKFFNHHPHPHPHQRFQEKIPQITETENMDSLKPPKKKKLKLDTIVANNSSSNNSNSSKLDGRRRSSGGGGGGDNVPKAPSYKKDLNCDSQNSGQDNQENKEPSSSPTSPSSKPSTTPKTSSQQSSTKRKQITESPPTTESSGPTKDSNSIPVSSSNHSISSITTTTLTTTQNSTSPTANAQSTVANTTVADSNNGSSFYTSGGDASQQHPTHANAITMASAYFQTMNFNSNNSPHAPPHAYMNNSAASHPSSPHQQQFQSHHYQAAIQQQEQQRQQIQQRSAFIGSTMGSNNGVGDKTRSTDFSINAIIGSINHQHNVHNNNSNNSYNSTQRHSGLLQRPSPQPALTAETAATAALAAVAANTTNTSQSAKGILNLSVSSSTPGCMAQYTAMMPHQLQSPVTSPLLSPGSAEPLNHHPHPHPHHLQHPHHLHSPDINNSKSSTNKAIDQFMLSSPTVATNPMLAQHFHALAAASAVAAVHPHQSHPLNNLNHLNNHPHHHHQHQICAPSLSPSTVSSMDSGDLVNGQLNNSGNHHHHHHHNHHNHHSHNNKNPNNHQQQQQHQQQQHNLAIVVDSPRSVSCRSPSPAPSSTSSSNSKEVSSSPRNNHCSTVGGSGGGGGGGKDRSNSRNSNNGSPQSSSTNTSTSMTNNPYASELKPKFNCEDLAKVDCHLENKELWDKFHELGTEMIITKTGRRMFPTLRCSFSGIESCLQMLNHLGGNGQDVRFLVMMDIVPVDNKRYRYAYHRSSWLVAGKADPPSQTRLYLHPDAPYTLEQLRKQVISFEKVKLTNNEMDKSGHIVLNSMHRYQPRVHLIIRKNPQYFNAPVLDIEHELHRTFIFPETVFTAVTAYQNQLITKLKIDSNPFAKGFRDSSRLTDLERETMESLMTEPYALAARPFFGTPFGLPPFSCMPTSYADLADPRMATFLRDRAALLGINPALVPPHLMLPNGFPGAALPPPPHQSLPLGSDGSQYPHPFGPNQMFWPPPPPPPPPHPSSSNTQGKQQTSPTGQTSPSAQQSIPPMSNGSGGGPNMDQLNQIYLQNPWYALLANGVRGPPNSTTATSAATAPNQLSHLMSNPEFWAAVAHYGNTAQAGAPLGSMGPINTKPTQMMMSIPSPEAFMKQAAAANHTARATGSVTDEPNTPTNMELSPDSKGMASTKGADSSPATVASSNNATQVSTTEAVA